jgi:hypothetical protein
LLAANSERGLLRLMGSGSILLAMIAAYMTGNTQSVTSVRSTPIITYQLNAFSFVFYFRFNLSTIVFFTFQADRPLF